MKLRLILLLVIALIVSCSEDDKNPVEPTKAETVTIHDTLRVTDKLTITDSDYILEAFETMNLYLNTPIQSNALSLEFNFSENDFRDRIKYITIYTTDEYPRGWQIFSDEFDKYCEFEGEKLNINHLGFQFNHHDFELNISFFGWHNETLCSKKMNIQSSFRQYLPTNFNWYNENSILLEIEGAEYYSPTHLKLYYLNNDIIIDTISVPLVATKTIIENVPATATAFYVEYNFSYADVKSRNYSCTFSLNDRVPGNAKILPDGIKTKEMYFSADGNYICLLDNSLNKIIFYDIYTQSFTGETELPAKPLSVKNLNGESYMATSDGNIYKIKTDHSLELYISYDFPISEFIPFENYMIIINDNFNNRFLQVYDIKADTLVSNNSNQYFLPSTLTFNDKHSIIYISDYLEIRRLKFDLESGKISQGKSKDCFISDVQVYYSPDKNYIFTNSGGRYNCSSEYTEDLENIKRFKPVNGMVINDNNLVCINSYYNESLFDSPNKGILKILDSENFKTLKQLNLYEFPFAILKNDDSYFILSQMQISDRYFIQQFSVDEIESQPIGKHKLEILLPNYSLEN